MKLILLLIPVALMAQTPAPGGGGGGSGLPPLGANGTCLTVSGGVAVFGSCSGSGNAGTVTSFSVTSVPSWLTASVATSTSTPALTLSLTAAQTSHQVIGTCGSGTTFTPCSLVLADLPGTVVNASSPGAGIAHFAGSTQTVTSSAVSLTADVSGILPIANGGTATATPGLVAGTNVTITGSWPNQTINSSGGGGGGGTVTVVASGSLTSTDCVTGGGTTTIQTPSANCTVDSSGNLSANSVTTTGSSAGMLSLSNNATPGTPVANSWGWTAPSTITTAWYGEAPNANPTSNQVMLFGAPSSNVSQWAWTNFTIAGMGSTAHNVEAPLVCADSSGSGTAQVCTTSPTFTPASGDAILYSTTASNTGDVTVNVNSLGAKHIRKWSAASTLASGDLVANTPVQLIYDGTYWEVATIGNAPGGTGTVTSIATTSPITGGTITSTGTIACATCVTSAASLPAGGIMYGTAGSQASAATSAGTAKQLVLSGGSGAPTMIDFPERYFVPAANCNNTTAGAGWSIGSGGTVTCRAGTNNQGGYITITDTSSTFAQFTLTIPEDWDTGTNPYIRFFLSSTDTTNAHTIIPQIKVSCPTAGNGTTSDDATFSAAQSSSTVTVGASAVSNGFYNGSNVQIGSTQMTGCIAGGLMIVQVGRATDTATSANFYGANVTFPRLLAVQAN